MLTGKPVPSLEKKDIDRFWSKVKITSDDSCWEWTDSAGRDGYGRMWLRGSRVRSNRIAYLVGTGENPNDLLVCHSCDNTNCCNPRHLFLGTAKDNAIDRASKGRCSREYLQRDKPIKEKQQPKPHGGQVKFFYKEGDKVGACIYLKEDMPHFIPCTGRIVKTKKAFFKCKCGNEFSSSVSDVRNGHTTSCGCYRKKPRKHGCSSDAITDIKGYNIWIGIKQRCYNQKVPAYKYYGALGITVCQEWLNSFPKFIEDMGDRPSLDHSIDRIENSKGYYKENCRWATKLEQANNKTINRKLVYRGISKNLSEWCRFLEIDRDLFKQQLNRDGREMEYCVAFGIVNKFKKSRTTLNVNKCQ